MVSGSHSHLRALLVLGVSVLFIGSTLLRSENASAQAPPLVLISHADSTRAIAFNSVTQQREPFPVYSPIAFGADNQTRIMLFTMNLNLQPGDTVTNIIAEAEDSAHNIYQLPVEYVGVVPELTWATCVVVKLHADMNDLGDVLVRISYRGVA
jgi:hypothetical protein